MEGKEIIQEEVLGNIIITPDSKGNIEIKQHWGNIKREVVIVAPNKALEVSLAICPELHSELEMLKTRTALGDLAAQNCVRLEKDLEKAKELIKKLIPMAEDAYIGYIKSGSVHQEMLKEDRELISKATTFLENSGLNKNLK